MTSDMNELQFQALAFSEAEVQLAQCVSIAEWTLSEHERRQSWRRACRHRLDMGERGAMIAEHIARWASK